MRLSFVLAFALAGCAPMPVLVQPAPVIPVQVEASKGGASPLEIEAIASASQCSKTSFADRGIPTKAFLKGIALSYARAVCHPEREAVKIASQPLGDASKDALAHYGLKDGDRLRSVYTLMVGSAGRESSWRWCVGRDASATNYTSETCETGLYQTSYNSRSASPVLPKLYAEFKGSSAGCFAAQYKGTATCSESNLKNWGTGEGVEFQRLSKQCPGFATEYHAVMLRTGRKHYGPINTKKAEFKTACGEMFKQVSNLLAAKPELCKSL